MCEKTNIVLYKNIGSEYIFVHEESRHITVYDDREAVWVFQG